MLFKHNVIFTISTFYGYYYLLLSIHTQFNFEQIFQVLIIKHLIINNY